MFIFAGWHNGIVVVPFVKVFGLFSHFFREGFVCNLSGVGRGAFARLTYHVSGRNRGERTIVVYSVRRILFFRGFRQIGSTSPKGRVMGAIYYRLARVATSHRLVRVFRVDAFCDVFRSVRMFLRVIVSRFPYSHRRYILRDYHVLFFRDVSFYRVNRSLFSLIFLRLPGVQTSTSNCRINVQGVGRVAGFNVLPNFVGRNGSSYAAVCPTWRLFVP